ncbi:TetR/AcrR family transcriptional regulator [Leucobacter sp. M11]|uniref:TetR/AcrR family transcriptional regulator n=1 Tax=Leucobacter sp. M11 TaxID=2993565 RepID=UPI002D7E4613|nr:TetR family transcriptional regulator [Leucobacter sp. M11]MEB4616480.1 TetR family transcriptional regulator [Leucobacter sp. M11]
MPDPESPDDPSSAPEGVRQRRNRETREAIHRAAIELVGTCDVREVTVAQIAERAGVSRRTFFRYYANKEQAILPGHQNYLTAIGKADLVGATPHELLRAIDALGDRVLAQGSKPELDEHEHVNGLVLRDPGLRAYAVTQDLAISERLTERLTELNPGLDPRELGLLADLSVTVWRRGWIRWASQRRAVAPDGTPLPHESPAESHRRTRASLGRIVRPGA